MVYPDANDPYGQPAIPYQPYGGQNAQMMPQQKNMAASSSTNRAVPTQVRPRQAKPVTPRKSKAETLSFVHECKKWLVAGSVVTFGLLGGLVAGHAVGTTSNQATPANNTPATSPSTNNGNAGDGGFFNQQPGQQQQQQGGGGYGFWNNNPSQPPVSGSQTS